MIPFESNYEIEWTSRLRRKKQQLENQRRKAPETSLTMAGGGEDQRRIIRDFVTSGVKGITSSIAHQNVEANNFELKPALFP